MKITRFPGPVGSLEGVLQLPEGDGPFPGVVVCHPHTMMGGNMFNNVVLGICRALEGAGFATLRFNFRGAGGSEGECDDGRGEADDALEAIGFMASHAAIRPEAIGLAGYSFGAGVAMKAAFRSDVVRALCVVARSRVDAEVDLAQKPSLPMLLVAGERDRMVSPEEIDRLRGALEVAPEVHLVPGADHFFGGLEKEVGDVATAFFQRWLISSAS